MSRVSLHSMRLGQLLDTSGDTSFLTDFSVPGSLTQPIDPSLYSELPAVTPSGGYNVADVVNDQPVASPTPVSIPSSGVISLAQTAGNVIAAATSGATGRGPSPTVQVPLGANSVGLFLEGSNLIAGIPNWEVILGTVALLGIASSFFGGKRRRR